mgnify:CR=1 FL=1|jgi:hypothetical protein
MRLLSGGQSGVDRAVLDVAIARGIAYGGWCPQGGWAEDYPHPPGLLAKYRDLKETPLADPNQRTEWNVRDADACMIIVDAGGLEISAGTTLAGELAHRSRKPLMVVNLHQPDILKPATLWLRVQQTRLDQARPDQTRPGADLKLAVGGPRESEAPGIYERAAAFLEELLE